MHGECGLCVNDYSVSGGLCDSCRIVRKWLPHVKYASEMDGLGLSDRENQLYFVYVLHTDVGTYVGHTANLDVRFGQHQSGRVRSTYRANPKVVWQSLPLKSRRTADNYERTLKTMREQRHEDFIRITGVAPKPWLGGDIQRGRTVPYRTRRRHRWRPYIKGETPRRRPRSKAWYEDGCALYLTYMGALIGLIAILALIESC